ncbi:MAG: hypothetical protein Q9171_001770 [Xanthocarpia ochracea]
MAFLSAQSLRTRCQALSTDECLKVCRATVVVQVREATEKDALCDVTIDATWTFLQTEETLGRFPPGTAAQWLDDIEKELGQNAVRKRIQAGERHRKKLAVSEAIIMKHWGIGMYDILSDHPYTKTISESLAQRLAKLPLLMSLDIARTEIKKAMADRQRSTTSGLNHMCNRDIDCVLSQYQRSTDDGDGRDSRGESEVEGNRSRISTDSEIKQIIPMVPVALRHDASNGEEEVDSAGGESAIVNGPSRDPQHGSCWTEDSVSPDEIDGGLSHNQCDAIPMLDLGLSEGKSRITNSRKRKTQRETSDRPPKPWDSSATPIEFAREFVRRTDLSLPVDVDWGNAIEDGLSFSQGDGALSWAETWRGMTPDLGIGKVDTSHVDLLPEGGTSVLQGYEIGSAGTLTAATEAALPTADVQGSLTTLHPRRMLSSTALELVLGTISVDEKSMIYDPLFFDVERPKPITSRKRIQHVQQVLLPLHHQSREHWTLAEFDVLRGLIRHHDSLPSARCKVPEALIGFRNTMISSSIQWRLTAVDTFRQTDNFSCGVHVLTKAISIVAGVSVAPFPELDLELWRHIFEGMLATGLDLTDYCDNVNNTIYFSGGTKHIQSLNNTSSGKAAKQAIDKATQELDRVTSSLRQADVPLQHALEHLSVASTDYDTLLRIVEQCEDFSPSVKEVMLNKLQPQSQMLQSHVTRIKRLFQQRQTRMERLHAGLTAAKNMQEVRSKAVAQAETEKENVLRNLEILKEQYTMAMKEAKNEEQRARERKENAHRELIDLQGG